MKKSENTGASKGVEKQLAHGLGPTVLAMGASPNAVKLVLGEHYSQGYRRKKG